jgi:hypothetical protein
MANSKISALTAATTPLAGTETLPIVQSSTTKQVSVANLTAGRAVNVSTLTATGTISTTGSSSYLNGLAGASVLLQNSAATANWNFYTSGLNGAIDSAQGGNLVVGNNLSVTGTVTPTGNVVIATSGKGIDFSATAQASGMTSELLADYEEGTWTPVITFATPGDVSVTYSAQIGSYILVGSLVTAFFRVTASAFTYTTASGNLQITGLPFTSNATTNWYGAGPTMIGNINLAISTSTYATVRINPSTTIINLLMSGTGVNTSTATTTNAISGNLVNFTGLIIYRV